MFSDYEQLQICLAKKVVHKWRNGHRGMGQGFLTTVLKPYYKDGEGVKNRPNFVTSFMKDPIIRQQRLTHIQHRRRRRRPFSLFLQKKNQNSFLFSLFYFHVQSIKNFITSFFCKKKFGKFFNAIVIFADDS